VRFSDSTDDGATVLTALALVELAVRDDAGRVRWEVRFSDSTDDGSTALKASAPSVVATGVAADDTECDPALVELAVRDDAGRVCWEVRFSDSTDDGAILFTASAPSVVVTGEAATDDTERDPTLVELAP